MDYVTTAYAFTLVALLTLTLVTWRHYRQSKKQLATLEQSIKSAKHEA